MNMKKIVIPSIIIVIVVAIILVSGKQMVEIQYCGDNQKYNKPDTIELNVYLENSGSMDAYMCDGSQLKDAVYDYVSKLKRHINGQLSLNYINSQIITHRGDLDSFIKNMNPQSFKLAGGDRRNTNLPDILKSILNKHKPNSISVFISDCILDVPEGAKVFFGRCQIAIRNAFMSSLDSIPTLGVEILKLESKFNGQYFYSSGSEYLENVKRPYYMWIIGDRNILAELNKNEPYFGIMHGIKEVCAFTKAHNVNYKMHFQTGTTTTTIPSTNKLNAMLYVDLSTSLQNIHEQPKVTNDTSRLKVSPIQKVEGDKSYSHVVVIEMFEPLKLDSEKIEFNRPYVPAWVLQTNEDIGEDIKNNIDKTTGIKYIIQGVADAYIKEETYTSCEFKITQK